MTAGWHRHYVPDDVETAKALVAEHHVDSANPGICRSGTHVYPCEWPCYRRSWAMLVLLAHERGEIPPAPDGRPEPA